MNSREIMDKIREADERWFAAGCPKEHFTRTEVVKLLGEFGRYVEGQMLNSGPSRHWVEPVLYGEREAEEWLKGRKP